MTILIAFLLCFAVGPGLFWLAARRRPTRGWFALIWGLSVAMIGAALLSRYWLLPVYPETPLPGLGVLLSLWLAWILVLALAVLAIRARPYAFRLHRVAFALGAAGTTLPWFGLYAAQMVTQK